MISVWKQQLAHAFAACDPEGHKQLPYTVRNMSSPGRALWLHTHRFDGRVGTNYTIGTHNIQRKKVIGALSTFGFSVEQKGSTVIELNKPIRIPAHLLVNQPKRTI